MQNSPAFAEAPALRKASGGGASRRQGMPIGASSLFSGQKEAHPSCKLHLQITAWNDSEIQ